MNLPNKLTILRIILTPIFMTTLVWEFPYHGFVSAFIFLIAAFTDFLDGKIARKRGLVTDFGKFLDPLADKMVTTAAFLGFIALDIGYGTVWIAFIVLFREFMVSSIRLIASTSGGKVIAANFWGKLKTVSQLAAIFFSLVGYQIVKLMSDCACCAATVSSVADTVQIVSSVMLWTSTLACVVSGIIYLVDNIDLLKHTK